VILENGEAWGIYSSGGIIYGALFSTATVDESTISISGKDFNFLTNTASANTFTGTFLERSSMSLTNSVNGVTATLAYRSSYKTPANLNEHEYR
jgi:hypothetical protein